MATIKSYSDLEQSRKLAEFLPLESADMYYIFESITGELRYHPILITEQTNRNFIISEHNSGKGVVSWSLAALLNVLPSYELNNFGNAIQLAVKNEALETEGDETLLDLVVNMIIYLHERKKL